MLGPRAVEKHKQKPCLLRVCFLGRQMKQTDIKISSGGDHSLKESKSGDFDREQVWEGLVGSPRDALGK